ncbi:hypothetical protein KPL71_024486 [Citrus sinensis]|uniref:Uncharacterized protein n=1 Tax=Citrus sinensis TaxID=2711 RepID=A0ACB8IRR6_CITSI|nr:hypothetical protein KPL71_024486 [Citrus sinensis]
MESASAAAEPVELEKPVGSDEKVDFDEDNDPEETMEEEYEYEEVEEEEEEEVIEEEVEEEVEEEEEDADTRKSGDMQIEDEDEKKKHAELLALPPHGSEVYIGGIPHDASEHDLRDFCQSIGEVTEVRIMKGKDSSENKGFAFVTFRNVELASKAIDKLNNTEFKGKKIRCSTSQAKYRLFIGNIPRNWGSEDLQKVVSEVGPGVTGVELVKKMTNPNFKLGTNAPTVSWADPRNVDSSGASQVKAVYVKNLPRNVTQDQLKKLFEHHGRITKVVVPPAKPGQEKNRIGFVHFAERSSAMKALKNTEKYELDGQALECSLAKPQADQKSAGGSVSEKPSLLQNYPPHIGYGLAGGTYGALGAGFGAAAFAQPLVYGRGASPAGMAMMPMLLPDGRIGYVLQQSGAQPHSLPAHHGSSGRSSSGSRNKGGSSSRGRHGDGGHGQRYRPY